MEPDSILLADQLQFPKNTNGGFQKINFTLYVKMLFHQKKRKEKNLDSLISVLDKFDIS